MTNCGICNENIPTEWERIARWETDGTLTSYHMGCEYEANRVTPCEDCGQHRLLCNDCAEPITEEQAYGTDCRGGCNT